jgi:rhodanese-related sulfurtransferase
MTVPVRRGVSDLLDDARSRLFRLSPAEAYDAQGGGAVLVDIRPPINLETEGLIPGALVVDRNVLEWRFDPACDARMAIASYDLRVVIVCNEGYTSSLAAAALHDLGVVRATDLIGGYRAWRACGLPTIRPPV